MLSHTERMHELAGWTPQEIHLRLQSKQCPECWNTQPVPTFALLELIRAAIESEDLTLTKTFPQVLDCLGLKQPKNPLGLVAKVKRYMKKASESGDYLPLCQEVPGLSQSFQEVIGVACSELGISPSWLNNDDEIGSSSVVSNKVVIELQQFRARKQIPWKVVVNKWWRKLFPGTVPPPVGTVVTSWNDLAKKKIAKSRNSSPEDRDGFLGTRYRLPEPRPVRVLDDHENDHDVPSPSSSEADDSGYDTSTSDDVDRIQYLLRSHGDTMANLHELLEDERLANQELKQQLEKEKELRKSAEDATSAAEETLKQKKSEEIAIVDQHKKDISKYKRELNQATELSAKLSSEIKTLKSSNVIRRLKTKTRQLENAESKYEELQSEVAEFKNQVSTLTAKLDKEKKAKKNKTEQLRYHKLKRAEDQETFDEENCRLIKQLADLEKNYDEVRSTLDEIMSERQVKTFEEGRYTEDIRVVCYELISRGVGSRHVSDIIKLVLQRVGGMDCGRLPKPTLIRLMAFEQALLAKDSARHAVDTCDNPVTLQMDGTTKKHVPYVATLASTSSGVYGIGLSEVRTETADILLEEAISTVQELLTLTDIVDNEQKVNELLMKMKNTMTDRCVVNKKFVKLLEDWRESTLPSLIDNWDSLSDETKQSMKQVNDLYCGKHVVLNFQEYAGSALFDWETVESNGGKLGREKHLLWNKGKESSTLLAVRTVCEAFGPDANPQAGAPTEFNDFLDRVGDRSKLQAYRGNRFNVPFENSAATYYHHYKGHVKDAYDSLPPTKQKNQLIRSVMYDLEDTLIVGGIRAMGIVNCHITQPLMSMLDRSDIHVMDTSGYYTKVHDAVQKWMVDPEELLCNSAIMFEDIPPAANAVNSCLYEVVSEEVEFNTKQALIIILHNMYVCIKRQLEDHLPGGKYHTTGEDIRNETTTCPKDNVAAERVFAGLDYLKRKSPNMTTLAMQGVLLWTQNKTAAFIDSRSPEQRTKLIKDATYHRKHIVKLYQGRVQKIKEQRNKEVEERKKARESKERQLVTQTISNTEACIKLTGFICKTTEDVEKLLDRNPPPQRKEAVLAQIKYYKSVNRGLVKGSLFFTTSAGKPLDEETLLSNLKTIIVQLNPPDVETRPSTSTASETSKEKSRSELKAKLLAKLKPKGSGRAKTGVKRKNPFPDNVVNKRIRHTCLAPCGKELEVYKGSVMRESTSADIDELMDEEYRPFLEQGFTFYTVHYDPPYHDQLFIYPLRNEWENGFLEMI